MCDVRIVGARFAKRRDELVLQFNELLLWLTDCSECHSLVSVHSRRRPPRTVGLVARTGTHTFIRKTLAKTYLVSFH